MVADAVAQSEAELRQSFQESMDAQVGRFLAETVVARGEMTERFNELLVDNQDRTVERTQEIIDGYLDRIVESEARSIEEIDKVGQVSLEARDAIVSRLNVLLERESDRIANRVQKVIDDTTDSLQRSSMTTPTYYTTTWRQTEMH